MRNSETLRSLCELYGYARVRRWIGAPVLGVCEICGAPVEQKPRRGRMRLVCSRSCFLEKRCRRERARYERLKNATTAAI